MSPLPNVAERTSASFLVNVWGSEDILAETGIGGYRSELVGFTTEGALGPDGEITKQLFNIEILGATHFDYMRDDNASAWNIEVARFVTDLMVASNTKDNLQLFLNSSPYVSTDATGKLTVRLSRWESHV